MRPRGHGGAGAPLVHLAKSVTEQTPLDCQSDAALLARFAGLRDEVAFAELMRRHGPLLIFSETPATPGPGTVAGQHTATILRELDYDDESIARLTAEGTVALAAE